MRRIYLDHAATTPLDSRVLEVMVPYLKEHFGNASSVHALGRRARFAIEESRECMAAHLGAQPGEIIFTSGGTEANNAALHGMLSGERRHLVTSAAEHEAILRPAEAHAAKGHPVTFLLPQPHGAVSPEKVREALSGNTGLVSLMHANNEIGTMTPISDVAKVCHEQGVPIHCDAVQTAGLFRLNVDDLGVDLMTISGHKFYGPKGVGALYVRGGLEFEPFVVGGAQERWRRGGTENVAAVVGLAEAFDLAMRERDERAAHLTRLRDRLYMLLREAVGDAFVANTPFDLDVPIAPHVVNIAFPPEDGAPLDGEMLLLNLDMAGIMASAGSACTSGALEPSRVLLALGRDRATASASVRFSLGKDNTTDDIDEAVERLVNILQRMRTKIRAEQTAPR
ncbi:MAG: cysteine desulfurase family protein [Rhodothermales bacterium]